MNLGQKTGIIVVIGIILVTSIITILNYFNLRDLVMVEYEDRIVSLAQGLAGIIECTITPEQIKGAKEKDRAALERAVAPLLQAAAVRSDTVYVFFLKDGELIAGANSLNIENLKLPKSKDAGRDFRGFALRKSKAGDMETEEIRVPVTKDFKQIGEVVYGFTMEEVNKNIQETKNQSMLISVIGAVAVSLVIMAYLYFSLLKPLSKFTKAAGEISRGEVVTEKIRILKSSDEIGKLSRSFKDMTDYIAEISALATEFSEGRLHNNFRAKSDKDMLGNAFVKITGYIAEIANVAKDMAAGNFSDDYSPKSENDVLGNSFKDMVISLRDLVKNIKEQSMVVANSSAELVQIADQLRGASTQLTDTVSHISQATTQSASDSQEAAVSSSTANASSQKGRAQMEKMLESIRTIQTEMAASVTKVNELTKYSEEINKMLEVIRSVSEETKLLSFNAAIEAARAGERGRGFAVVAEEIRKLSDNSAGQVQKITVMTREIRLRIASLADMINKESDQIIEGAGLVSDSHAMFMEIAASVDQASSKVESIAASSQEIAASAEQSAAASEEQTASVQELSAAATDLENTAKILRESVEKFRV